MAKNRNTDFVSYLRSSGLRKRVAKTLADLESDPRGNAEKLGRRVIGDLRNAADAIEKRLDIGGAGKRSTAAKKGASTRKRAASKRSASAKKGAAKRARKTTARKTTPRKTTARKTTARKTTARKTGARKTSARKSTKRS
jgi:hypothetical protein